MSSAPRLSEMVGIHDHRDNSGVVMNWITHAVLLLLGGTVLWLAFRFLQWDDPRWLYNPWAYAIATPFLLVGLSFLLRGVVSRVVERTAQIAFLLSLVIHLGLLAAAVNIVIETQIWTKFFEDVVNAEQALTTMQKTRHQMSWSSLSTSKSQRDYLRYVPTQHEATELKDTDSAIQLAKSERADVPSPVPKLEVTARPFLMERETPSIQMARSMDTPAELSRAELLERRRDFAPADSLDVASSQSKLPELAASRLESNRSTKSEGPEVAMPQSLADTKPEVSIFVPKRNDQSIEVGGGRTEISPPISRTDVTRSPSSGRSIEVPSPAVAESEGASGGRSSNGYSPGSLESPMAISQRARTKPGSGSGEGRGGQAPADLPIPRLSAGVSSASGDGLRRATAEGRDGIEANGTSVGKMAESGIGRDSLASGPARNSKPIDVPNVDATETGTSSGGSSGVDSSERLSGDGITGSTRRERENPGLPTMRLDMDAPLGLGGISPSNLAGSLLPRTVPTPMPTPFAELDAQRFSRKEVGGPLSAGTMIPIPKPAFQQRLDRLKENESATEGLVGPQTELAIERGLEFLAKNQRSDGVWRLQDLDPGVLIRSDTAATGLALLAFQGAGYTHQQYKYSATVQKGLAYLIKKQQANGDLYIPQDPASDQNAWLYSHAIATLALCEAYGMTQDDELREPAERAVKFMVYSQDPHRGGWRYRPGLGSDTSVTGWFMMALKSAQLAGLNVPPRTFEGLAKFLEASQSPSGEPHLFRYNPFAVDNDEQRHGLKPTHTMTSVGLLMRLYLGWQRDMPQMQAGADYLLANPPQVGTLEATKRDTYYWYYATQVMFHMGGERWRSWHAQLHPLLIDQQIDDGQFKGSWDPYLPTADLWARFGGRHYVTTMNLLSLEVNYRHLPLYEATGK